MELLELVKYDETIHPEVWLNKVKLYCYKNQITKDENIIKFCKSMIHPSIDVSKANTFEEILNILKTDFLFTSFKQFAKGKLYMLNLDMGNKNYIKFINLFREYCYEAEVNDLDEQKEMLLRKLPRPSYQERRLIGSGSCVTLKHVATGKYLTARHVRYKTGSKRSIVYASETLSNPNSLWTAYHEDDPAISGKSKFLLINKGIDEGITISKSYKSPSSGKYEVCCSKLDCMFLINKVSTNDIDDCIKTKEIVNIRDAEQNFILRSHDVPFTINNETYQEVVGHEERIGGNDKWCIELFEIIQVIY
ncbi:hypothetical protein RclHR1_03500012 [Rhizophagus clarus]|uniref:MIR domain-containing protein n=1 Tax=Rhizophagus clarus TaxID=94130 RepID=A0A2Z6RAK7_9GLOM|nr:hypothetical protein RclHR1_03500012 [Rhizophagus clarus]